MLNICWNISTNQDCDNKLKDFVFFFAEFLQCITGRFSPKMLPSLGTGWEISHRLSERLPSHAVMGVKLRDPLSPLNTTLLWWCEGFKPGPQLHREAPGPRKAARLIGVVFPGRGWKMAHANASSCALFFFRRTAFPFPFKKWTKWNFIDKFSLWLWTTKTESVRGSEKTKIGWKIVSTIVFRSIWKGVKSCAFRVSCDHNSASFNSN